MAKPQQTNNNIPSLSSNLGGLEPNVVGFTIEGRDLQKMALEYLRGAGFNPAQSIVTTKDNGRGDLILRQYLFFEKNDPAIYGGNKGGNNNKGGNKGVMINPALGRKLPSGGVGLTRGLQDILAPIALPDGRTRAIPAKNNLVVVEVDPIAITGLLLDVEPGVHRIIITNVAKTRNSVMIDVFKRLEENSFDPGANVDRFTAALRNIR